MIVLKEDTKGLVPVIMQDITNGQVLMLGYISGGALKRTMEGEDVWFYSRSRDELWHKGELSGNYMKFRKLLVDCDQDTLLIRVKQKGGACHLGYRTCFVHQINEAGDIAKVTQKKVFDPESTYQK